MITVEQYHELLKAQSTDAANYAHGGRPTGEPGAAVAEWLSAIQDRIWEEGYEAGRDTGYDEGREYGYEAGYDSGYESGYSNACWDND